MLKVNNIGVSSTAAKLLRTFTQLHMHESFRNEILGSDAILSTSKTYKYIQT